MARDISSILPSSVQVAFPIRRCGQPTSYAWPDTYTKTIDLADLTLAIAPDVPFVGHPGRKTLRSTALALYTTPAGPPTNQAALDALARAIAQAYYDHASVDVPGDVVYGGITTQEPNALTDTIEWNYRDGEISTRLQSPPLEGAEALEFQHWDSVASCTDNIPTLWTAKTPCIEVTEPLSLSGSNVRILRKKICLEAGRLIETVLGIDLAPCGCTQAQDCGSVNVTLTGCGPKNAVVVTLSQGGTTIGTGTTNSFGQVSIPVTTTGTITASVTTTDTRLVPSSNTFVVPFCDPSNFFSVTITWQQASGWTDHCCIPSVLFGPPGICSYPGGPHPTTLFLSDGFGTVTLTYAGGGNAGWRGCAVRNLSSAQNGFFRSLGCSRTTPDTSLSSAPVYFYLDCNNQNQFILEVTMSRCVDFDADATCADIVAVNPDGPGAQSTPTSCNPLAVSFSETFILAGFKNLPWFVYGDTHSFAVSA
jgi:hypothetical protein